MNNKSSFHPRAVITDIDGTITNKERRLNLDSVSVIRTLVDNGIPVVLASGNTECSLTFLCKMIGTDGTIIAENGGLYKITYAGERKICSDRAACLEAYEKVREYYDKKGIELQLYSPEYRFADVAFARTVDPADVREIVSGMPVKILDSGFAIHIQSGDINKGTTLALVAEEISIPLSDFVAVGDSDNDREMIQAAGLGIAVAGGQSGAVEAADSVSMKKYGDGFSEKIREIFSSFF
ncbi:phosphoglycolate phosphatase [Methanolacinia petrolearia]|uniref:phosphoglycolate phosphatase n=1 Tax=Methanolacinia petrolearia TaxID=54120 RepID=UPI003BAB13EB